MERKINERLALNRSFNQEDYHNFQRDVVPRFLRSFVRLREEKSNSNRKRSRQGGDSMRKTFLAGALTVALLMIPIFVNAQVYKWVDEKGNVHFTDDYSKMPEKYRSTDGSQKIPIETIPLNMNEKSGDFVVVDGTEKAYTVYALIPKNRLDEIRAKLSNVPQGIVLLSWETFMQNSDKYIKAQIAKNEYPESRAIAGVVKLVRKFPGTPIGLTWNGGIAITYNDYQHAKSIYEQYKADPAMYERNRNRDPRNDPINPKGHLGPLLGW